jgi:hypothetical protein
MKGLVVNAYRLCDCHLDLAQGRRNRIRVCGHIGQQDNELVAAQANHGICLTDTIQHPLGRRLQELVTGRVTKAIVHKFEIIEIHKDHGNRRVMALRL